MSSGRRKILLAFFILVATADAKDGTVHSRTCGPEGCPISRPGYLNVHIICHSHNDAGWLDTLDIVYDSAVRKIYTTTTEALLQYPERKYISAENVFFARWWRHQTEATRHKIQLLVEMGRLQFVGGGWVQNDEATTHYTAIIDQQTLGMRFLNETFGKCGQVKVGWQMDPFGHSQAMAAIFAQMGFSGLFIGRVTKAEWQKRAKSKRLEFIWKASPVLGKRADIFTGITHNWYFPPRSLCIADLYCATYDSRNSLLAMSEAVLRDLQDQSTVYGTDNIMVTVGADQSFQNGHTWFTQLDAAMQGVNGIAKKTGKKVQLFYSTPLCYVASLYQASKAWPVVRGDFFPYADGPHRYWTGYYTSRPNLKFYARYANGFLQACKQLSVLGGRKDMRAETLKEAVAILQHHDAITGTSKWPVAKDYASKLTKGVLKCQAVMRDAVVSMMYPEEVGHEESLFFCHLLNISQCAISESRDLFTLIIYNPMSHDVVHYVRLPVTILNSYEVTDHNGEKVEHQLVGLNLGIQRIPERESFAKSELVFPARLPALGYTTLQVRRAPNTDEVRLLPGHITFLQLDEEHRFIENEWYQVEVDTTTGLVKQVTIKGMETVMRLRQSFYVYKNTGTKYAMGMSGGAYSFRPDDPIPSDLGSHVTYRIVTGKQVEEIHQIFNHWVTQVVRLYKASNYIEFDWVVGPLPDKYSTDLITRYETDMDNAGTFYTDSNGLHTIRRSLNDTSPEVPIGSSYYPVVSWIYIQSKTQDMQMTVVTDRAQGGSSINRGSIELMLHRRHFQDDGLGVTEPLDDRGEDGAGIIVRGRHLLHIGPASRSPPIVRDLALQQVYMPVSMFSLQPLRDIKRRQHSELRDPLPPEAHLLTLEALSTGQVLVRLQHYLLRNAVNVSISKLLVSHTLTHLEETFLGANEYRHAIQRPQWKRWTKNASRTQMAASIMEDGFPSTTNVLAALHPGQMRTFLTRLGPSHYNAAFRSNVE